MEHGVKKKKKKKNTNTKQTNVGPAVCCTPSSASKTCIVELWAALPPVACHTQTNQQVLILCYIVPQGAWLID